jgi:abequosyltransferase
MIKITFCIPTYNRADYLKETIDCIINQSDETIEIVVSDNCSNDNTEYVVYEASKKFSNIKYFRWDKNEGADLNYLKSVELASGEFCWFMGSDDIISPNAIKTVKQYLNSDIDVALCSQFICSKDMVPLKTHYLLGHTEPDKIYRLGDEKDLVEYFTKSKSHSALFGYLSTIIFRRERWNSITYDKSYTGTLYSHMFMLYSFLENRLNLQYIRMPLVFWRGGNDSFGGKGKILTRFWIDFNGFKKINNDFFINKPLVSHAFKKAFRSHHPLSNIAYLRLNTTNRNDWREITKTAINDFSYPLYYFIILSPSIVKLPLYGIFLLNRIKRFILVQISAK